MSTAVGGLDFLMRVVCIPAPRSADLSLSLFVYLSLHVSRKHRNTHGLSSHEYHPLCDFPFLLLNCN